MARKGENIYKRKDGRWEGRYIRGRKPNGQALYRSVYGKKYTEVKLKLFPLKSAYVSQELTGAGFTGTVWDWLLFWLNELGKPNIKTSTYAGYRNKLENHVLPVLGGKKLTKLNVDDIQNWITGLTAKGLAGSSVRTIYRIFNAALQKAVCRHYLVINPCKDTVLPGIEQPGINAIAILKQKELEKQALKSKDGEAVILALYTGMRIGEISALTWEDIDFENELIYVRRTLQRVMDYESSGAKTKIITDIPKSNMSYRIIPFGNHLKTYLLKRKALSNSSYVVSSKGNYAEPRVISYRFRQTAKKAGLENATFHGLRHTYATRCIERGVDIVTLSRLLGHASAKMTLDTYADSTIEQRKSAMTALDALLSADNSEVENAKIFMMDKQKSTALLMQLFSLDLTLMS